MRSRPNDEAMAEIFRQDPDYAVALLNDILADGDHVALPVTLRQMIKAFGGMTKMAEKIKASRTQLYKTLSEEGNPELRSLSAILETMGLRLAVQPIKNKTSPRRAAKKVRAAA